MMEKVNRTLVKSLLTMADVVEARDTYTGGHLWRVSQFSKILALEMGLDKKDVALVSLGGFLHDLGKVGVPDAILGKAGKLTEQEYEVIKTHPQIGKDLIDAHPLKELVQEAIHLHHERWDGKGYPIGHEQEQNPLFARMVGLVDAFDAMTSTRPYRKGMPIEIAMGKLQMEHNRQFDGRLVDYLTSVQKKGLLNHIVGHSDQGMRLLTCDICGPIITVPRTAKDGDILYCRHCTGEYRIHQDGDYFVNKFTGNKGKPMQLKPSADLDVIDEFVQFFLHGEEINSH